MVTITESLKMELDMSGSKVGASVLCPGFVDTKISDSERNRPPGEQRQLSPGEIASQEMIREMARQQVAAQADPGGDRWDALGIFDNEHVITRGRVVGGHRSCCYQTITRFGERQRDISLVVVEGMRHCPCADECHRGDIDRIRRADPKTAAIGYDVR